MSNYKFQKKLRATFHHGLVTYTEEVQRQFQIFVYFPKQVNKEERDPISPALLKNHRPTQVHHGPTQRP